MTPETAQTETQPELVAPAPVVEPPTVVPAPAPAEPAPPPAVVVIPVIPVVETPPVVTPPVVAPPVVTTPPVVTPPVVAPPVVTPPVVTPPVVTAPPVVTPPVVAPPVVTLPPVVTPPVVIPPVVSLPPVVVVPPLVVPAPNDPTGFSGDRPIAAAASALGFTTLRVQATAQQPIAATGSLVGAFRNPCAYSHMAFDDPIVFPNQSGSSHLHVFFGNTSTNAYTTTQSLSAAKSSTCTGGTANLSAYWIPALVDPATNKAIVPGGTLFYYKKGYNQIPVSSIQAPPAGLRFIGGNKASQSEPWSQLWMSKHTFECDGGGKTQHIPYCAPGKVITLTLVFPNCWDGVNLDSPDHRSHMAYSGGGTCPSSHPVAIPETSFNIYFSAEPGQDSSKWRLASDNYDKSKPGGYSMHGDVWFNWDAGISAAWVTNCVRNNNDCHAFLTGDGRALF